jgi:membrane protein
MTTHALAGPRGRLGSAWTITKDTISQFMDDNAMRLGAALAFYTALSFAPLVLLAITIAGQVWGTEAASGELVDQMNQLVGPSGAQVMQSVIANSHESAGTGLAAVIGIVVLLFGATGVFAELQDSLNAIWNVRPREGSTIKEFLRKRLLSLGMILGIGFLLLVSLIASAVISFALGVLRHGLPGIDVLWRVADLGVSLGVFTLLFALIYKFVPDVRLAWRDVWVGAAVTAVLFAIGRELIGLYVGRAAPGSAYGAAGSLIALLIWVYYSALIFFLGAEFTQVLACHAGRKLEVEDHAEPTPCDDEEAAARPLVAHPAAPSADRPAPLAPASQPPPGNGRRTGEPRPRA